MIIKRFQAKTEQEAVENAKKELGLGVVIMNVKNVLPENPSTRSKRCLHLHGTGLHHLA